MKEVQEETAYPPALRPSRPEQSKKVNGNGKMAERRAEVAKILKI
jgi:hypothetical protein